MKKQPTAQDYDRFVLWAASNRPDLYLRFALPDKHECGFCYTHTQAAFDAWQDGYRAARDEGRQIVKDIFDTSCPIHSRWGGDDNLEQSNAASRRAREYIS